MIRLVELQSGTVDSGEDLMIAFKRVETMEETGAEQNNLFSYIHSCKNLKLL